EPTGSPVNARGRKFGNENDRDANGTAEICRTWDENIGTGACELSDFVNGVDEAFLVVGFGADLLHRAFTLAQPGGCGHWVRLESGGFPISDFGSGPEGFPFFNSSNAKKIEQRAELLSRGIELGNPTLLN